MVMDFFQRCRSGRKSIFECQIEKPSGVLCQGFVGIDELRVLQKAFFMQSPEPSEHQLFVLHEAAAGAQVDGLDSVFRGGEGLGIFPPNRNTEGVLRVDDGA